MNWLYSFLKKNQIQYAYPAFVVLGIFWIAFIVGAVYAVIKHFL